MATLQEAQLVLQKVWGFQDFRPPQKAVLPEILSGRDALIVFPTGGGKSLLFQVPALLTDGNTLVFSPLISLMKDQVDDAVARGLPATYVNSEIDANEARARTVAWVEGRVRILYVAPERMRSEFFMDALSVGKPVTLVAVDEAHCHPPDTLVTMADGSQRRIDQLSVGERVLAQGRDGKLRARRVTQHRVLPIGTRKLLRITTSHGSLDLTDDHKLWIEGKGEVEAQHVREGDTVLRVVRRAVIRVPRRRRRTLLRIAMLGRGAEGANARASRRYLRGVRDCVRAEKQGPKTASEVLLQGLCERLETASDGRAVPRVRDGVRADRVTNPSPAVLFRPLQVRVAGTAERRAALWDETVVGSSSEGLEGAQRWNGSAAVAARAISEAPDGGVGSTLDYLEGSARFSFARAAAQCGVRRVETSNAQEAGGIRSQARCRVEAARVDRIEVLERGDSQRDGACRFDHRLVHSLTVEVDHNYFAGGLRCANCASAWGHDFRPPYSRIFSIIDELEERQGFRPQVVCVTATATHEIEEDVARACGLQEGYYRHVADPIRPNLQYEVLDGSEWHSLRQLTRGPLSVAGAHVVYVSTRKLATGSPENPLRDLLLEGGVPKDQLGFYHAGMSMQDRKNTQDGFKAKKLRWLVATSAFGMGIDVDDIRTVVHFGIPDSLESYVQQAGRAGRDDKPSRCILLHSPRSASLQQFFLDSQNPPHHVFKGVWDWICSQEGVIRATAESIQHRVEAMIRREAPGVGAVLGTLEAYGLVERRAVPSGVEIRMDVDGLHALVESEAEKKSHRAVWDALLDYATPSGLVYVEKATLAQTVGYSAVVVNQAFKRASALKALNEGVAFRGKSTQRIVEPEEFAKLVPFDRIKAKRDRAQFRLDEMLEYADTSSAKTRIEQIRSYFMGPEAKKV